MKPTPMLNRFVSLAVAAAMLSGLNALGVSTSAAPAASAAITVSDPGGTSANPYVVNLTDGNYDDWAHFGNTTATAINRKAGADGRLIGGPALIGSGTLDVASANDISDTNGYRMRFDWTDGAPIASASTKYFVKNSAEGIKLDFALPAGAYELKLYGSVYNEMADAVVTDTSGAELARQPMITGAIETWALMARMVTIEYKSDAAQTITVSFARTPDNIGQYPGISMAAATVKAVAVEPVKPVSAGVADIASPGTAAFSLDSPDYSEWTHYGLGASSPYATKKAAATTNIVGTIARGDGGNLTSASNAGVPAFSWTGGAPTASASATQYYAWAGSGNNLSQKLNFPAGNYVAKLYLIGLRVTANLTVTGSVSGDIFSQDGIYTLPAGWTEARGCKILTIGFNSNTPETVTVLLTCLANNSGSMAVQAVTVQDLNAAKSYAVTASASPSSGGTVTGAGSYAAGAAVHMTASPNAGYEFKQWQVVSGDVALADSASPGIAFTMPASNVELLAVFARPAGELLDLTQYINMRVGTSGASNTLIGTQRPNASVSPGPDTNPQNGNTGYNPTGLVRGFSQIHVSGTGVGKYGEFLVSPQIGLATRLDGHDSNKSNETPTPSEYSVTLTKYNITASFTPAEHSSIYKFVYPQADNASLLIDAAANIGGANPTNVILNTGVNQNGEPFMSGSANYSGGWGSAHNLYFYAVLQKPGAALGLYNASGPVAGTSMGPVNVSDRLAGMGAYATFATAAGEAVYLKIATSFKSIDQAKTWLDSEIPAWDYNAVRDETDRQWNEELNKVVIDGNISDTNKQIFYTAVYHAHIMPRDRTGDIAKFGSSDMIDDHFCFWDTWRTLYPLYSITNPDLVTKTVNSLITRYQTNSYTRDSFVAGVDMPEQQGGDNVDNVIADAYVKGIQGVDWEAAYKVVKNEADNYRLSWLGWGAQNLVANVNSQYKTLGYIPVGGNSTTSNCSYTLEYAYNDYCAAEMAKGLGKTDDYQKYLARSNNWTNIWNPNLTNNGYTGFINPRNDNFGAFVDQNPTQDMGSWNNYFYEASAWNYSFFVPHDVKQLIDKMGGQQTFANRLSLGVNNGWVDFGNEPAFLAAALFNYTDRPWMTSDAMAAVRAKFSLNGVPGNDDSGAMSSWYIFSSTGFFPNAGQNIYYITSPIFESTTFNLDNGKQFSITAHNLSAANKYIQSVTINGKPYYGTYFTHDVITNGGTIVYEMGPNQVNYAKAPANSVKLTANQGMSAQGQTINLSDKQYSEWAHFTSPGVTNRKAGVANPVIGDVRAVNGGLIARTSDIVPALAFSWSDGTPAAANLNTLQYTGITLSGDSLELPLSVPAGSRDVTVYFIGYNDDPIGIEVFDETGAEVINAQAQPGLQKIITLSFDCQTAGDYTLRLTASGSGVDIAYDGVQAATVANVTSYTVKFNTGGAGDISDQIVRSGQTVAKPANLTRAGYVFGGWYSDSAFTAPWNFDADTVAADMTLYAKWIPLYTVTFVANGGGAVASQTVPQGGLLAPSLPSRTGYDFQGWFASANFSGSAWNFGSDTVQGNITLYAKWTPLPAVSLDVQNITAPTSVNLSDYDDWAHYYGASNGNPPVIIKKAASPGIIGGTVFDQYYNGEVISGSPFAFSWSDGAGTVSGTNSKAVIWSQNRIQQTFDVPAGGYDALMYVTGIRGAANVTVLDEGGAAVSAQNLWGDTKETRQYGLITLHFYCDKPREFTAVLSTDAANREPADYSVGIAATAVRQIAPGVTVISGGNGSVSGGGVYEAGSNVTVTATPDSGYRFKGWQVISGSVTIGNTASASFAMPDKSVTLKAVFEVQTVWVRSLDAVANLTHITLSQPQYADWAYLGYNSGPIRKADAAGTIFTSNVSAVTGGLTQEDMATYNSGSSPYFTWTGGTPTAAGTDVRVILWNAAGIRFNVSIPKGLYEIGLYISGVRAGASVEVLDSAGNTVMSQKLWNNPSSTRYYWLLNLDFDCKAAQTYTVRLLTTSDTDPANFSVSLFAGIAQKLADYYTVTAVSAGGGTVTGGGTYAGGGNATVTAVPDGGYAFDGWYNGDVKVSGDAAYTFPVAADITLTAKFAAQLTGVSITGANGTVTARYDIYNGSSAAETVQCILAVYDQSGRLSGRQSISLSAAPGANVRELGAPVGAGYTAKAFIWDGAYAPMCAASVWTE